MATEADRGLIETFVNKSARPLYNYRMGRAAQEATGTTEPLAKGGLTKQKRAEQELHDLIMNYAMTYAVTHNVEVS